MTTCLLIVDVQRGFINAHTRHIPQGIESLQRSYAHIVATRFINGPDTPHAKILHWHRFLPGSEETAFAFTTAKNTHIITKHRYGCIDDSLLAWLRERAIATVDLCGIDTDMCVFKNAVDLFDDGIRPRVLTEHCASHAGREYHDMAIRLLERAIGKEQII